MSSRHLVDPELLPVLEAFPSMELTVGDLPAFRAQMDAMIDATPLPSLPVAVQEVMITAAGAPNIRALLFTPETRKTPAPAILHIHGGAYIIGRPEISSATLMETADALGCVILSVDYRLAPETQHPGPIEDCYAALAWLHANASRLGIDAARIAVMGESAGGGLSAALALLARDRGEYAIAFQLLDAPMMDDRTCTRQPHPVGGEFVFTPKSNSFGWRCLLGQEPGSDGVSPYAAAARAEDLAGLPPAFVSTGALDLFLDENLDYVRRLALAAVPVELHVYPGAPHGFALAGEAAVTKAAARDKLNALRRAFAG
jgi:acetyl esterase/lipase